MKFPTCVKVPAKNASENFSAKVAYCIYFLTLFDVIVNKETNNVDPDQTAPIGSHCWEKLNP